MTIIRSVLLGSVAALASASFANAGCEVFNGLTYCNAVSGISYDNVGDSGSYKVVAGMKSVQKGNGQYECQCEWGENKPFSGPLAPLNEPLSLHLRGPMKIKQIAFYHPGSKPERKEKRHNHSNGHAKRHGHHIHRRAKEVVTVTSTIVVNPAGETIFPVPEPEVKAQGVKLHHDRPKPKGDKPKDNGGNGGNGGGNGGNGGGNGGNDGDSDGDHLGDLDDLDEGKTGWLRKAYFNADSGTTDGMVIMNYMGGEPGCSGEWTFGCGSSLSYASGAKTCTKNPSPLTSPVLNSDEEFVIFSSEKCGENDPECGFSYGPAHKGFGGSEKIFMFEFMMPEATGGDGPNYNLPAIWALNARIPRTQQYGDCSCWNSGCGELDIFEVIKGAADKVKTHFHSKQGKKIGGFGPGGGGGSPDYIPRPTSKFIKAAVIFDGSKTIRITLVPDSVSFSEYFDDNYAEKLKEGLGKSSFSTFTVGQ